VTNYRQAANVLETFAAFLHARGVTPGGNFF
jgi:hypothetical protein